MDSWRQSRDRRHSIQAVTGYYIWRSFLESSYLVRSSV